MHEEITLDVIIPLLFECSRPQAKY